MIAAGERLSVFVADLSAHVMCVMSTHTETADSEHSVTAAQQVFRKLNPLPSRSQLLGQSRAQ